jgi:transcription elongation GreA/GreB family factor
MSRAFVREGEGHLDDLPDRPISDARNDVTSEGLAQIEAAIAAAQEALAVAQAEDDRSAIASASRDLRYWSARRASAQLVAEPEDDSQVRFGHAITILRDDGRRQTFRIVGEDEADPAHGSVSHASPLARALFGRSVGDVVRVGGGEAEILNISRMSAPGGEG